MKKIILLSLVIAIISGCVYYNTFYNARQYFQAAQEEPLRDNGKPSHNAIQNYTKAMKKCGIILTDYKESKWADDALFMLAQCLYYRQTKLTEAKNKFEEVIQFYPDSDYALESPIYIARCLHDMNQKEKAYQKLREYIVSANSRKYLPEALMQLAEYYLEEEEYSQAEYNYQKLIDEYPKSELHETAFFTLGILYHSNKEYDKSIQTFKAFLKVRADKKKKLDARYYIASSFLLADDLETAAHEVKKLLDDEYREQEINNIMLIKARVLARSGETDEADIIFDQLITENDNTALAAEASFWRAEMHFRLLNNYELAIEYYNNVRTQFSRSEFVEQAVTHSAVASQILQYNTADKEIELKRLISEQMKLAEYYVDVLDLPDSAMAVYNGIINYRDEIALRRDSLQIQFEIAKEDTAFMADSISPYQDSLAVSNDSLDTVADSLTIVLKDSTLVDQPRLAPKADSLLQKINALDMDIIEYDQNFIPYVKFVKLWMYRSVYKDSLNTDITYNYLKDNYPDNRYTYAAEKFMNNEKVEFITRKEEIKRTIMNEALNMIYEKPDSALVILKKLSADSTDIYYDHALFARSFVFYHIYNDTLSAKPLIDSLIAVAPASEWADHISLFYDGQHFKELDRLPGLVELENKAIEEKEAAQESNEESEELIMELEDIEKPDSDDSPSTNTPLTPRALPPK